MSPTLRSRLPQFATAAVLAVLYITACFLYHGFFSVRGAVNLLTDNAALGIASVGMTLVIFSGGIDLSVGAVAGFTTIFTATLIARGIHPGWAVLAALGIGATLGAGMGAIIHWFRQPPFLITLAGMFLMRGCAFWITTESIGISHPAYDRVSAFAWTIGDSFSLSSTGMLLLAVLGGGAVIAHYTRLGRNLLAIGGGEQSALLMGLPVGAARIAAYTLNSICATIAGLALVLYTGSGNPSFGIGLELDAIAVVVIGGTLLSGGRGHMFGTLLGLLIFGIIQAALIFDGRLSSHWTRIVVGALLLAFILLQRLIIHRLEKK
jgi:ribose/xylose/arabinose/galactoside ABC-type transport system permease subunit